MIAIGTIVEVYEDPGTMLHKEGNARIVEQIAQSENGIDLYNVCFIGDDSGTIVERWISESPICRGIDEYHCDDVDCPVHGIKSAHWVGR